MTELLNTRCGQGKLILTDTHIIIELGRMKSQTMARSAFTTLETKWTTWIPGSNRYTLVFHGQGSERLKATMVKKPDMLRIRELLTGR